MALYGLFAMVVLMLSLVAIMAWYMPGESAPTAVVPVAALAGAAPVAAKVISADAIAGKALFAGNGCNACHNTNGVKLVGPGLKGIRQRVPSEVWLQKWIRNSSTLIATGDGYAKKVFAENGNIQMTSFPNLNDQQIKQILDYVDAAN